MHDERAAGILAAADSFLPDIPLVETGTGGPLRHAALARERARALRDECLTVFPPPVKPCIPAFDQIARHWLTRSGSPYVPDIAAIAEALGFPGVWLLNASYQWGCTALAREEDGVPWLGRTLDWPFPGLGRHTDVVRMDAPGGPYFSVSWPGYAGVLTAMAPRRFAACINQAPMWRRTRHPWLRLYDVAANGLQTWTNVRHAPPDHVLRQVFETCETYGAARAMLETVPVARPVIFTLIGCAPGERCVIERTETSYVTRQEETSAANDWVPRRPMWEARMAASQFLTLPADEVAARCHDRRDALARWTGRLSDGGFAWVQPPVLNSYTRLAVTMSPARAVLRVAGYEMTPGGGAQQVTRCREVCALTAA